MIHDQLSLTNLMTAPAPVILQLRGNAVIRGIAIINSSTITATVYAGRGGIGSPIISAPPGSTNAIPLGEGNRFLTVVFSGAQASTIMGNIYIEWQDEVIASLTTPGVATQFNLTIAQTATVAAGGFKVPVIRTVAGSGLFTQVAINAGVADGPFAASLIDIQTLNVLSQVTVTAGVPVPLTVRFGLAGGLAVFSSDTTTPSVFSGGIVTLFQGGGIVIFTYATGNITLANQGSVNADYMLYNLTQGIQDNSGSSNNVPGGNANFGAPAGFNFKDVLIGIGIATGAIINASASGSFP